MCIIYMVNWKYVVVGIIIMIIAYKLYLPYNFIFGAGEYSKHTYTFYLEIIMFILGFITIVVGIGKDK